MHTKQYTMFSGVICSDVSDVTLHLRYLFDFTAHRFLIFLHKSIGFRHIYSTTL